MDTETGVTTKSPAKHDISSYVTPTTTMSGDSNEAGARPSLRDADHALKSVQMVRSTEVEGKQAKSSVRVDHIVKIFKDDDDFIEVSPEQVERVKILHEKFEAGVNFSFNYNVLLLVASVVAALGLVSNSGATVVASMLVSSIMGPVVGLAYGTTINDWKLVRLSLRNECISLLFCIMVGLVIGAITGETVLADDWMTDEMESRATLSTFLVALPVAFFSGLGVAVSLLDEQTSSLVGVAISASLLPPAVNAGIVWVYYAYVKKGRIEAPPNGIDLVADQGLLSLFLTFANILLIWVSSMLMFRMKEVLPIEKKVFWSDLGVARKIYRKRALLQVVEVDDVATGGVDEITVGKTEQATSE